MYIWEKTGAGRIYNIFSLKIHCIRKDKVLVFKMKDFLKLLCNIYIKKELKDFLKNRITTESLGKRDDLSHDS